jgi:hypothetical protein
LSGRKTGASMKEIFGVFGINYKKQITPVGIVRSDIKNPMLMAGDSDLELQERMEKIREYHQKVKGCVCELVISPQWVELLDGSPIIDIKPYVKPYYGANNPTVTQWMEQLHRELEVDI